MPTPPAFRAIDLPGIRDQMVRFIESDRFPKLFLWRLTPPLLPLDSDGGEPLSVEEYQHRLAQWLRVADLFYVTPAMTAVAVQAAGAIPNYRLHPDDLPAKVGLVVWAAPIAVSDKALIVRDSTAKLEPEPANVAVHAALWAPRITEVGPGVHVVNFTDLDRLMSSRYYDHLERAALARMRADIGPLYYNAEFPCPYAEIDRAELEWEAASYKGLFATWLLMGQRIAAVERERMPGALVRRYRREGRPEPLVRSVSLRRPASAGTADRDGQGPRREYHHTWIVSGHWRNQAHGVGREQRKPVYIAAYVKGPEGAPLIGGERVNVLRR